MNAVRLALVLVGDELLQGRTVDANGAHLARRAFEAGTRLVGMRTVGDDPQRIADAVRDAAASADLVVVSGGLGPTEDDRTRDGLALALGVPLVEDERAWAHLAGVLARRGRAAHPSQRRQALIPRGARPVENPEGTAPGIAAEMGGALVLCLPGVPREFRAMVESAVLPAAAARGPTVPPAARSLYVAGLSEAEIGATLGDLWSAPGIVVGSYPHEGEIEIRFTSRGDEGSAAVRAASEEAARRLGVAAVGEHPLAETVLDLLRERGLRLAVAESMTGGLVAAMLTEVPGASDVLEGGFTTYSDRSKEAALGIPADLLAREGAVSEPVARAMAERARARSGAEAAVAVTGAAGPTGVPGPSGEVPPGTVFVAAVLGEGSPVVERLALEGLGRAVVRRRAALAALDLLRRLLLRAPG